MKRKDKSRDLEYDPVDRKRKLAQKRLSKKQRGSSFYEDDADFLDYIDEF